MTDQEIQARVEEVLVQTMRDAGFESASVEAKPNPADEDALFVTVRFRSGAGVTRGHTTADALVSLRRALESKGEHRFPCLIYDDPDDPPPYADVSLAAE